MENIFKCVVEDDHEDIEDDNWSLEGYVFANAKQLRQIKAKYVQRDTFEKLLLQADAIHEVIQDSFHPGVDRIIMSYL